MNVLLSYLLLLLESIKLPITYFNINNHLLLRAGYFWYRLLSTLINGLIKAVDSSLLSLNRREREKKVIVSLTSFPARIENVYLTIYSLFLQTYKPDRIVLWLAESQFQDKQLPDTLLELQKRGLEIKFCLDYKSHKKYYWALQEQQENEVVITFDDDIIYDLRSIERAMKSHHIYPKSIVVNMSRRVALSHDNDVLSYKYWKPNIRLGRKPSFRNSPLTGSGCLYPFNVLRKSAFDFETIQRLAFNVDDLWIYVQSVLSDTTIVAVNNQAKSFTTTTGSQEFKLTDLNCAGGGNDVAIKKLLSYYPGLINKIYSNCYDDGNI